MPPTIFNVALATLPFIGLAAAGPTAIPFSDPDCENKMPAWSYTARNGTTFKSKPFDTGAGVSAFGNSTLKGNYVPYSKLRFSTPEDEDGSGTGIYWKFSKFGEGCRVIFMTPFQQNTRGSNIPGNVVLNGGNPDTCYYTDPGDKVFMTYCCGVDDCAAFNVGDPVLNTKREAATVKSSGPAGSLAHQFNSEEQDMPSFVAGGPLNSLAHQFEARDLTRRSPQPKAETGGSLGSLSARAQAQVKKDLREVMRREDAKKCGDTDTDCWNREWKKCKIISSEQPISMPGQQVAVSSWLNCNTASGQGCQISMSHTTTHSSEVSVSQTNSDTTGSSTETSVGSEETNTNTVETTNTDGYSLSVGASIGWGPFSVSTDATTSSETTNMNSNTNTQVSTSLVTSSQSFSQTVANTTGHAMITAKGESVSQTFTVMNGGYARLTFLPFFDCWTVTVDCGSEWDGPKGKTKTVSTQNCRPAENGGVVTGSYSLLYSNSGN